MSTRTESQLADALREVLISPNVSDTNGEAANVVDALANLSRAMWHGLSWRSDPRERPNAIEGHSEAVKEGAEKIADGLESIASAIGDLASAIREHQKQSIG